jgi:hypothetical protein
MDRSRVVDLNSLARSHSADLARMTDGIRGEAGVLLWTSELRTAVRGGKPLGGPHIEDSPDSDRND